MSSQVSAKKLEDSASAREHSVIKAPGGHTEKNIYSETHAHSSGFHDC